MLIQNVCKTKQKPCIIGCQAVGKFLGVGTVNANNLQMAKQLPV